MIKFQPKRPICHPERSRRIYNRLMIHLEIFLSKSRIIEIFKIPSVKIIQVL